MRKHVKSPKTSCSSEQEQSALYYADKIQYTPTFADLFPRFKEMVMTASTRVDYHQTQSGKGMLPTPVATASGNASPSYHYDATYVRTTKRLTSTPVTNEEHYLATGGIIYSLPPHFHRT